MTSFDTVILGFLTQIHLPPLFDHAIRVIAGLYTFKGFLLIPLLWWIWFEPGERRDWQREMVIATVASGLIALAVGRLLAHFLPFRERPIFNPDLHLHFATDSLREAALSGWSSFPSDHAMLWCAVAMGIFLASRPVGAYALLHAVVLIGLPRIYLGVHYPTDVLAGAALGIGIAWVMSAGAIRTRVAAPVLALAQHYPAVFYGAAFVLSFELATQFQEPRVLAHSLLHGI